METYAIPLAMLTGLVLYAYQAWFAEDRDDAGDPEISKWISVGLLGVALVLAMLVIVPEAVVNDWTLAEIATADLPTFHRRFDVYLVYALSTAGSLGLLHTLVATYRSRKRLSRKRD